MIQAVGFTTYVFWFHKSGRLYVKVCVCGVQVQVFLLKTWWGAAVRLARGGQWSTTTAITCLCWNMTNTQYVCKSDVFTVSGVIQCASSKLWHIHILFYNHPNWHVCSVVVVVCWCVCVCVSVLLSSSAAQVFWGRTGVWLEWLQRGGETCVRWELGTSAQKTPTRQVTCSCPPAMP